MGVDKTDYNFGRENVYEGPLHFSLSRSSKLFKMVEQLKAAIMKDRVKFFLKKIVDYGVFSFVEFLRGAVLQSLDFFRREA